MAQASASSKRLLDEFVAWHLMVFKVNKELELREAVKRPR